MSAVPAIDARRNRAHRHLPRRIAVAAASALLFTIYLVASAATDAHAAGTLLSQGKPTTASSTENAGTPASAATDGNTGTRWSSAFSDPQWLQVDLGTTDTITEVSINWEAAFGKSFQIQTSNDGTTWTNIFTTTTGGGGLQDLTVSGTGRFVRMNGTVRGTQFGYSIWEFQVFGTVGTGGTGTCNTATNAALNKPATASSTENASFPASNAFDGNTGTRWSSAFSDPQWLQVDLGTSQTICQVTLTWEAAFAKSFQIQTSNDGTTWTNIFTTTTGAGGVQTLTVNGTGRFVRMNGTVRGTAFGYSLFEFAVFTTATGGGTGPIQGGGSLGPNVIVFDPSMSGATIQSQVDSVFNTQQSNQFGTQRFALLFKPGSYSGFNAQIGFYTSIMGLGQNPDQVQIHGDITVDAGWNAGNATQNFWRSASNMEVFPSAGFTRWAVAQAGPFRRMDIQGDLNLAPNGFGFASGGYISDSRITGTVQPFSQQQFFIRNSNIGGYLNGVWNMVNMGTVGAPATQFPNPPYTNVATTPVSRDEPYLYLDAAGNYNVFVPSTQTNTTGASWLGGNTPGDVAAAVAVLRRPPRRLDGDHQRRPRPGSQPAVHAGRLQHQPDHQRDAPGHRRARHRLPDADPAERREHDAGRRRQRRTPRGHAVRRRYGQLGRPADGRHGRIDDGPRRRPDVDPGRVLPDRRRLRRQGDDQPDRQPERRADRPHLGLARRPRYGRRVDGEYRRHRSDRQRQQRQRVRMFVEHYQRY